MADWLVEAAARRGGCTRVAVHVAQAVGAYARCHDVMAAPISLAPLMVLPDHSAGQYDLSSSPDQFVSVLGVVVVTCVCVGPLRACSTDCDVNALP
jgi:hypothetical protein